MPARFDDRSDAGRRLAQQLLVFRDYRPVVLALPRGGVPIGFEIALALGAPLDVLLVQKIGTPWQPDLAVGAVVDGGRAETVINQEILASLELSEDYVYDRARRALEQLERRGRIYEPERLVVELRHRTVIVTDDGLMTGATMRAALQALRRAAPQHVVLAVPVAPRPVLEGLRGMVDKAVCLTISETGSIADSYRDFGEVTDREVAALLARAARRIPRTARLKP